MTKEPQTQIIRQIKVSTSKIIPIVTEGIESKKAILRYGDNAIEVKKHMLTQKMVNLLEKAGVNIEYFNESRVRGRATIKGIPVKVLPINHKSYDSGAFIQIYETSDLSYENTNKVLDVLLNNNIDWEKECTITEEKVCMIKR